MKTLIHPKWNLSPRASIAIMASFATIGAGLFLFARAATTSYELEAEKTQLSGKASYVSDTTASSGRAVLFGDPASAAGSGTGTGGGTGTGTGTDTGGSTTSAQPATLVAVSDVHFGVDDLDRNGTVARVKAMAANADYVIMAGGLVYDGIASQYQQYDAGYGSILSKLRPAPGNHDNYSNDNASSYDSYFTSKSVEHGTKPNYWYSFNAGAWHIVSLNTGVDESTADYDEGSEQLKWLESDLAANSSKPTLLYFHAPRYTGSNYYDRTELQNSVKPIWKVALAHKVDIIVNGHDHSYQRFALMDEQGNKTPNGIRQFIAATGCYSQRNVDPGRVPNLEAWSKSTQTDWCGALQLKLYPDHYEWEFHNNADKIQDSGTEPVHAR